MVEYLEDGVFAGWNVKCPNECQYFVAYVEREQARRRWNVTQVLREGEAARLKDAQALTVRPVWVESGVQPYLETWANSRMGRAVPESVPGTGLPGQRKGDCSPGLERAAERPLD